MPLSILLVDDDWDTLSVLRTVVARQYPAAHVFTALDGKSGLEAFLEESPQIVITDLNMPQMGGLQMVDQIRAVAPGTEFIIVSARPESLGERACSEVHLHKPVILQRLFELLDQAMHRIARKAATAPSGKGSTRGT